MGKPQTILIAGAGLGGLTAAIALLRRGFTVRVFERAPALKEMGAGLTLAPTALRVFHDLGLWEPIRAATCRADRVAFVHYQTGELLHGDYDCEWSRPPSSPDQGGHAHRARVHEILVQAVRDLDPEALVLGRTLTALEQTGAKIRGIFAVEGLATEGAGVPADAKTTPNSAKGHEVVEADLFIGADGLRSTAHRAMFTQERPPVFTGVAAVRCMIPRTEAIEPFLTGGRVVNYVGYGRNFHRYGIDDGRTINCVALAQAGDWRAEGWTCPVSREAFAADYADFHPDVRGLIANAPEGAIFKWALFAREPLSQWSVGRATLLGDAAHPMLPYLGQGATAAIEDALVLARALESYDDVDTALAAYEADRRPRTTEQMRLTQQQGDALNAGPERYTKDRPDQAQLSRYDPRQARV